MNRYDYVIIGNSAAGIAAAESIRAHDAQGSICMLSQEPYAAYGKPLISYVIEGKTDAEHLSYRDEAFYERLDITCGFGPDYRVVAIDAATHKLELASKKDVGFKKCLLACGSTPFVPESIQGWQDKANIHAFEALDDALAVQDDIQEATRTAHEAGEKSRAIVVGGGLTGLKAAEALQSIADEIIVLTHGPRIMSKVLDDNASHLLVGLLEKRGIQVLRNVSVARFEGDGARCTQATLTDGSQLAFDVAVTAVGVRPAVSLGQDAGAACENGIVIGKDMQTTLPDIYAAGDVAQAVNALDASKRPFALWANAVKQGAIAGANMAGAPDAPEYGPDLGETTVDFFDVSVMSCGIVDPLPDDTSFEVVYADNGDTGNGYAKFVLRDGALAGYILINHPEACGIYNALIGQKISLDHIDAGAFARAPRNLDFSAELRQQRLHPEESLPADDSPISDEGSSSARKQVMRGSGRGMAKLGTRGFEDANSQIHELQRSCDVIVLEEVLAQRYLGCGMMTGKRLEIHGVPGNDMGCYMEGGSIEVFGNAQDQVANTMDDGEIIIHGRVGDAAGYGMRGGRILVRDGCGWRVGINMKQYSDKYPELVIGGDAGSFLGEYMAGGTIVLLGKPGPYLATGMHGGVIYLAQRIDDAQIMPGLVLEPVDENDRAVISKLLNAYNEAFIDDLDLPVPATGEGFWRLRPATKRPYAAMYAPR